MYRLRFVVLILALSWVYAVVRYVILGPVSVEHLPLFITNKALAMAGVLLLATSLVMGPILRRRGLDADHPLHPRRLGTSALFLSGLHGLLSLLLLNPNYFAKFFATDKLLTWQAEMSLLTGGVALILLLFQGRVSQIVELAPSGNGKPVDKKVPRRFGLMILFLTILHTGFMGYGGWLTPRSWHGGLPPITLLAAIIALLAVVVRCCFGFALPKKRTQSDAVVMRE